MSTSDGIGFEIKAIRSGTGLVLAMLDGNLAHVKALSIANAGEFTGYSESNEAWLLPLRLWNQFRVDSNIEGIVIHEMDSGQVYEGEMSVVVSRAKEITVVNNEPRVLVHKEWFTVTERRLKMMF